MNAPRIHAHEIRDDGCVVTRLLMPNFPDNLRRITAGKPARLKDGRTVPGLSDLMTHEFWHQVDFCSKWCNAEPRDDIALSMASGSLLAALREYLDAEHIEALLGEFKPELRDEQPALWRLLDGVRVRVKYTNFFANTEDGDGSTA